MKLKDREKKISIEIKVVEDREMNDSEIETVTSLLFNWWRREFESQNHDESSKKNEK